MRTICGHFNFQVIDKWILCCDCEAGIDINSTKGQRILERARGKKQLHPSAQAAYDSMVESYQELVAQAKTTDPQALADYANGRGK